MKRRFIMTCNKCQSKRLARIRELDPDTRAATMSVVMKCEDCGHEDEYEVISHNQWERIRRGFVRV